MSKLTKLTAKPQAASRQFAAIRAAASGTTTSFASASSTTTTTTASSIISNRGASTSMDNFPALGGGTRPAQYTAAQAFASSRRSTATTGAASRTAQIDMSTNSFPSLGGGPTSNTSTRATTGSGSGYAAADALSKRLKNQANVSQNSTSLLDQHFPAASTTVKKKVSLSQKTAKPISRVALDNVLDFPAPPMASTSSNSGAYMEPAAATATKQSMKLKLGENRYKQLKKLTKSFGQEKSISPEDYIDSTAALFHDGIQDELFIEFVPTLVSSCGIESISKRAMNHLESLRAASGIRSSTTAAGAVKPPPSRSTWNGAGSTASSSNGGWNRTPTISAAVPLSNNATTGTATTTTKKKKAKAKNNALRDLAVTRK